MLHSDLGSVLDLLIRPVQRCHESRGGHRARHANLSLATHLGPGNRSVTLVQHADRGGGEQKPDHTVIVRSRLEAPQEVKNGGNDAGGAVRRRRDHPPTCRVFLVHRQRIGVDPVHRIERPRGRALRQHAKHPWRPATHLEYAGEHT